MHLVKAIGAGLLVVALAAMWANRAWLVDAYRADEPAASVRLSGVDLAVEVTDLDTTPYRLPMAPDTRDRAEPVVLGAGATPEAAVLAPPSLAGGEARLEGVVIGPDGPVAEAVVRVERHTDNGIATMDAITGDDGAWAIAPVAGGRYRLRAWLPGLLTMGRSEVRFVADDEVATFDVSLWGIDPSPVLDLVDGGPLYQGVPGSVAVVVGWRSVDLEGLVVTNPTAGALVTVETTPQVEVLSPQPVATGADGVAWVQVRCLVVAGATGTPGPGPAIPPGPTTAAPTAPAPAQAQAGPAGSLTARTGTTEATFALPGCLPIPEPEPEPTPDAEGDGTGAPGTAGDGTGAPGTGGDEPVGGVDG